jgi:hypothetical protein
MTWMNGNDRLAREPDEHGQSPPNGEYYILHREPLGRTRISGPYPSQQAAEAALSGSPDEFAVRRITPAVTPPDPGIYCYGRRLRERIGWQMYLGEDEDGRERWELITDVQVQGGDTLLTVEDGTTYRATHDQAVRCRRPPPQTGVSPP